MVLRRNHRIQANGPSYNAPAYQPVRQLVAGEAKASSAQLVDVKTMPRISIGDLGGFRVRHGLCTAVKRRARRSSAVCTHGNWKQLLMETVTWPTIAVVTVWPTGI